MKLNKELFIAFFISIIPIFFTGIYDYWAEVFIEYLSARKISDLYISGNFGYFTLYPNLIALINIFTDRFIQPAFLARLFSSLAIFLSIFYSLSILRKNNIKDMQLYFLISISYFLLVAHPSLNSLITIGYFFYIPFLLAFILDCFGKYNHNYNDRSDHFAILAMLSKPTMLFLLAFKFFNKKNFFIIFITSLFFIQFFIYYLTNKQGHGFISLIDYILAFLTSSGAVFSYLFLAADLWWEKYYFTFPYIGFLFIVIFSYLYLLKFRNGNFLKLIFLVGGFGISCSPIIINPVLDPNNITFSSAFWFFSKYKMQYRIIPIFYFLIATYLLLSSFYSKRFLFVIFISLLLFPLFSNIQMSTQTDVSNSFILDDRTEQNFNKKNCFVNTPLPGWGYQKGSDNYNLTDSLWISGNCKTFMKFSSFNGKDFENSSTFEDADHIDFAKILFVYNDSKELSFEYLQECGFQLSTQDKKLIIDTRFSKDNVFNYYGFVTIIDSYKKFERCYDNLITNNKIRHSDLNFIMLY